MKSKLFLCLSLGLFMGLQLSAQDKVKTETKAQPAVAQSSTPSTTTSTWSYKPEEKPATLTSITIGQATDNKTNIATETNFVPKWCPPCRLIIQTIKDATNTGK